MKEIHDHTQFTELENLVKNQTSDTITSHLYHFLPASLESYCKIFHTIYIDMDLDNEKRDWSNYPRDNPIYKQLLQRSISPTVNFNGSRITWKELADFQGIYFGSRLNLSHFHTWSVKYVYEYDSLIDGGTKKGLATSLIQSEATLDYYYGYWAWEKNCVGNDTRLYKANLLQDGFIENSDYPLSGSVAYWWAIDKSWYICRIVESDCYFSYCGASQKIIDTLLNDNFLEIYQITIGSLA